MKPRKPIRTAFFVLLVVSSICSYIYLNTYTAIQPSVLEDMQENTVDAEQLDDDKKVALPDVKVIQKVVRGISRLVPAAY